MQRFLCWDDKNIEKSSCVRVCQHEPQRKNIALKCSDSWEGVHNGYAGVMKIDGKYRMYYCARGQGKSHIAPDDSVINRPFVCVAESDDGINFRKIVVGRHEFDGDKNNNIVFVPDSDLDTFSVIYDTNPDCDPNEKFKAIARDVCMEYADFYASADGFDFHLVERIGLKGTFDTYNVAFWDEDTKEYRMYFRGFHHPGGGDAFAEEKDVINDIRDVRLATSKDFRNWDYKGIIEFEEGQEDIPLYTNQIVKYYREPETLIGFPVRYVDRDAEKKNYDFMPFSDLRRDIIERENREGSAITDCAIMTSRDGFVFDRRRKSFMAPGVEGDNNWWYGDCYTVYGLLETPDEYGRMSEISFYAGENYRMKNVDFRRFTVRIDGFFSWCDDANGGTVITKPFVLKGENMFANFATSALGSLVITLLDRDGNELDGYKSYTAFGNSVNRPIVFDKPLKDLLNKEIRLRIEFNDCHLYSYTFE